MSGTGRCERCGGNDVRLYPATDRLLGARTYHVCRPGCGKYYHSLRVCLTCLGPSVNPGAHYPLPKANAA